MDKRSHKEYDRRKTTAAQKLTEQVNMLRKFQHDIALCGARSVQEAVSVYRGKGAGDDKDTNSLDGDLPVGRSRSRYGRGVRLEISPGVAG